VSCDLCWLLLSTIELLVLQAIGCAFWILHVLFLNIIMAGFVLSIYMCFRFLHLVLS
jgi:hypothetical protein